jgi:hypothetical protein
MIENQPINRFQFASLLILLILAFDACSFTKADAQDIVGKVIAGYQGWFASGGDGSPVGCVLAVGTGSHNNFETYPDMREFPATEQFDAPETWGKLPNGNTSTVFASDRDFTIQKHTQWMKQYGIDTAAIQRFGEVSNPTDTRLRDQKNDVTIRMMKACEKTGVKFYIEYDSSGSAVGGWGQNWVTSIENDWSSFALSDHVAASSAYARENGKPVVELWGMGLNGNNISKDPQQWQALVTWFQQQGCYVIGGVPTGWLACGPFGDAVPGFQTVYESCSAINPWIVGRLRSLADSDSYALSNEKPEQNWCARHSITYIPCVYPGTSFYNSNSKSKNNIPRNHGLLMWEQFANLRQQSIKTCFVSMFDEYNEATAIAKSAEDTTFVPPNKWFLTLDADGTPVSSDYYLRLTKDGSRMIKGISPLSWTTPTQPWNNLFDTGFEPGQPQATWSNTPDHAYKHSPLNVTGLPGTSGPQCFVQTGTTCQSGTASLFYSGLAKGGNACCSYKVFDLSKNPVTVTTSSILYYWINPQQDNGRFAALDLLFTDGTTLSGRQCTDQNSQSLSADAGHGGMLPLNSWSVITSNIGKEAGKKIKTIRLTFERKGAVGSYSGFIDDIRITY